MNTQWKLNEIKNQNRFQTIKGDRNGHKYISFRIDVCFSEYSLAVEVNQKGHTDNNPIFGKKGQEATEK